MPSGQSAIIFDLPEPFWLVPAEVLSHDGGYAAGAGKAVVVVDEQAAEALRHEIGEVDGHLPLYGVGDFGLQIRPAGQ
jgi:hypothetical protein